MDFFTAGIALIGTQVCVALVMSGISLAAPRERCTRYWAMSEVVVALGALLAVFNAGSTHDTLIVLAHTLIVWSAILQWWGLQAFYGRPTAASGWAIGGLFLLCYAILVFSGLPVPQRILMFSAAVLLALALSVHELWRGGRGERTFGTWLVLSGLVALIANNLLRIAVGLVHPINVGPATHSSPVIATLFLVPMTGVLLYATGVLLLYFERIVKEKHHLATHDELTGLLNRRAIVAGGERELALAARQHQVLAVALVDIDFFKKINDRLGHEAGDAVLVDLARLLKKTCRHIDLVGRYGGEEFCIVLPGASAAQCPLIGERLLAAVRHYRFRDTYPVTVSIGFASHANGDQASWHELVNCADAALYRAKNLGRDRICIAEPDTAPVPATRSLQEMPAA